MLVLFSPERTVYLLQAGHIMIVKLPRLDAKMSDPGREKPGEVPSSTAQRPTESPGGGKDEDGRSERAQNQRRHAPEVYAALQQLLFEGQLRLVLADDSVSDLCVQLISDPKKC